ncbi:protein-disulfide reductase DsbD family protein [Flectobacillus major]|uniref:protein-disulfide reductase DsbD family protein n=1 Tax=Flectobacillus major TaxID=103 RepID=UPI00041240FB|nr:cytochrome c biogenesis protein CcdA [Flectobacillus major]
MKKLLLSILLLFTLSTINYAQKVNPAKWTWALSKPNPAVGETVDIIFTVNIQKDWYLYSSDFDPDLGPIVTTIKLKPDESYEAIGSLKAINPSKKFDKEIWNGEYTYFKGKAEFRQSVKILKDKVNIEGSYDSQSCSDVTGQCVPVKGPFLLEALAGSGQKKNEEEVAKKVNTDSLKALEVAKEEVKLDTIATETVSVTDTTTLGNVSIDSTEEEKTEDTSLWGFFLLALGGGFVALLTPCVYPLIPMTVSYFTKQKGGLQKALLYGFFIIAIYVLFGTIIAYAFGQAAPNFISTHWLPNLLFFVVFVVFGVSFLGWFEIVLPSSFVNKIDAQSDRGGLGGIFFMAFTLVLVSFSCTGPVAGTILSLGSQGQIIRPIIGMFGFGLAFAVPFTLFAIFPNWLQNLPKSGGWMNSVKVVLGFLELALALKFLSTADQTYHWHILDREVYLAAWIVIFSLIGLYLLGKIQLPHDSKVDKVTVPRALMAIAVLSFVVYMIPGMFGAPLKALSGWLPPMETQDFVIGVKSESSASANTGDPNFPKKVKYDEFLKLPLDLQGFFDYKEALAYAQKVNKPLFIDFTGHGCVNCRKMEASVWSNPAVKSRLENDYVVVALYVDDKTELPKSEWYKSKDDGLEKTSIGDQNLDFEITRFNGNAQPYYCLVNPNDDAKPMVKPRAYNEDIEAFVKFLDEGKAKFNKK